MPAAAHPLTRRPALDGFRGVAILLVLAHHLRFPPTYVLLPGGWIGVPLFFALSGYLISGVLLAEHRMTGAVSLPRFYARRAARLAPALLAYLTVVTVLGVAGLLPSIRSAIDASTGHGAWGAPWLAALTFTTNLWLVASQTALVWPVQHLWSLSVEEQFYLLWPAVLVAAAAAARWRRLSVGMALASTGAAAATIAGFQLLADYSTEVAVRAVYFGSLTYLPALLGGAALAVIEHRRTLAGRAWRVPPPWQHLVWPVLASLATIAVLCPSSSPVLDQLVLTVEALAVAWLALVAAGGRCSGGTVLASRLLVWFGQRSYGLYIYQYLFVVLTDAHHLPWQVRDLTILPASLLTAEISWRLLEQPVQRTVRARLAR